MRAITPSRAAWRGASVAVLLVALSIWTWLVIDEMTPTSIAAPLLIGGAAVVMAILGSGLVILALAVIRRAPTHFRWATLVAAVLLAAALMTAGTGLMKVMAVLAITLAIAAITGGAVAIVVSGQWRSSGRRGRVVTAICIVAGGTSIVAAGTWLAGPGRPRNPIPRAAAPAVGREAPKSLADPADKGPYDVKSLTYGSGDDRHRPEFGDDVALRTKPVDASEVLKEWSGFSGWARTRYWGFDSAALPLNGRVWYPAGDGPYPLVLIVHGNHSATESSDPGYAYLGRLLASRGYIVVSVDENFLNSMQTDLLAGLEKENNARGWLLLEHLRLWHDWNEEENHPFFGRVDTDRIALVGHSRGGEAAAHAAAFNRLPYNPDNARARFDYNFNIRSVAAIAPADGQYQPAGTRTPLENVNYFVIQGSHDSDVSSFVGLRQYDRIAFRGDGDWFKSAVYVYGANHGQFNTTWGAYDIGDGLTERFISTAALLDAADQRRVLTVYLSAYLDCTLRGADAYRPLFADARYGKRWLPDTVYLTQYADSTSQLLCTFDDDIDLSTPTIVDGKISSQHLSVWREGRFPLRSEPTANRAVFLGWDRDGENGEPVYEVAWPPEAFELGDDSVLSFCLADADEDPTPDDDSGVEEPTPDRQQADAPREPLDLTVELTDAANHVARLPLGHFARLQPQIETQYLKSSLLHGKALSEPIFQTFRFRLADFEAANPDFDPRTSVKLRLVFDRTKSGVVIFDNAAFGESH